MRVVIDTNVLVSGLLKPESLPAVAVERVLQNGTLLLSPELLTEYENVLSRNKFSKAFSLVEVQLLLVALVAEAVFIIPFTEVADCVDASDNKLLELAVDGLADCIITGDDHLLVLHPFRGVLILSPAAFLKLF